MIKVTNYRAPLATVATVMSAVLILVLMMAYGYFGTDLSGMKAISDRQYDQRLVFGIARLAKRLHSPALLAKSLDCDLVPVQGQAQPQAKILACRLNKLNQFLLQYDVSIDVDGDDDLPQMLDIVDYVSPRLIQMKDAAPRLLTLAAQTYQAGNTDESRAQKKLARELSKPDPFRLLGCVRYAGVEFDKAKQSTESYCKDGVDVTSALPHANAFVGVINAYRTPWRNPDAVQKTISLGSVNYSTPVVRGAEIALSIDPAKQALAQTTLDCYAGKQSACALCPWCSVGNANQFEENARLRMAGLLLVNAKDGAIIAAASSHTPCYAVTQQQKHQGQDHCIRLPSDDGFARHYKLANHALVHAEQPGSMVKPFQTAALLHLELSVTEKASLADILRRSDTEEMIDLFHCKERNFDAACAFARRLALQKVSQEVGWNTDAPQDIFSARQATLVWNIPSTQMLSQVQEKLDAPQRIERCANKPRNQKWTDCRYATLTEINNELRGQGQARAAATNIAQPWLHLVSALNQQNTTPQLHMISAQEQVQKTGLQANHAKVKTAFDVPTASAIEQGLSLVHTQGTAKSSCLAALKSGYKGGLSCMPSQNDLKIISKTGTPSFPDGYRLAAWNQACSAIDHRLNDEHLTEEGRYRLTEEKTKLCARSPIKWFALAVGPKLGEYDTIMIVLTERNWLTTGQIDSVNDEGSNVAAELGLALVNRLYTRPSAAGEQK